jgi:ABC-type nitrate/sulfonate/bicarbonate transport system substrate-binding protein
MRTCGIPRVVKVIAVLALGLCLVAGSAGAQGGPPYKLKLPGVISYELNLPSLVAHANGYLADEGIEITDFVTGSGGTLRVAMIAREFDIGLFGFIHVPIARLAGSPWKAVISTHDLEIFSLVVRSELKDRVKTVADLRGMKVGFTTPGAASWALGSVFLKKAGLSPEKDVQYISLGGDPGVFYTALKTGKVDAIVAWEPVTTRVIEEGVGVPLVRIWEPEEHERWVGGKVLGFFVTTREDVIKEKRDLVRRMVNAHKKALAYIRAHASAEIRDVVLKNPKTAQLFKGLDPPLIVKMFDRIKSGFGDGCLSRSGFDREMKMALEHKLVKRAITFEEFADTSFAGECP